MNLTPTSRGSETNGRRRLSAPAKLCLLGSALGIALLLAVGAPQSSGQGTGGGAYAVAAASSAAQDLVDGAIVVATSEDNNVPKYPAPDERLMVSSGSATQEVTAARRSELRKALEPRIDLEALSKGSSAEGASPEDLAELVTEFMNHLATSLAPEASAAIHSAGGAEIGAIDSAYASEDEAGIVVVNLHIENGFADGTQFSLDMVQGTDSEWRIANARTAGLFGTSIFGFDLREEFQQYLEEQ